MFCIFAMIMNKLRAFWQLVKEAASDWSHDRAPRLGAALAYYTVFSMVPLLVVIIALIGVVFGEEAAQSAIMAQIAHLVGEQSAAAIKDMIQRASQPSTGLLATLIAIVTLLVGASGVFGQLQDALNAVWGVEPKEGRGIWGFIKDRFLSFVAVLGTGFLLLVSLVLSSALAAFGKWFSGLLPLPEAVLETFNFLLSFVVVTGLFALIFKVLPDARIAWRDVWVGAALTSALFTIGKFAIGLYLGKAMWDPPMVQPAHWSLCSSGSTIRPRSSYSVRNSRKCMPIGLANASFPLRMPKSPIPKKLPPGRR